MSATSKTAIMGRIRQALADGNARKKARAQAVADWLGGGRPRTPVPSFANVEGAACQALFESRAQEADASLHGIASLEALPRALRTAMQSRSLPLSVRAGDDPLLRALDWRDFTISFGAPRETDESGLTFAAAGLAETGSLIVTSGSTSPITLNFLPPRHFVVLRRTDICPSFEALWRRLREEARDVASLCFITGPSRTADIEQTLQRGAHGPLSLDIFLEGEARESAA